MVGWRSFNGLEYAGGCRTAGEDINLATAHKPGT
jgi:hypothetical protein